MPPNRSYVSLLVNSKWLPKSLPAITKAIAFSVLCIVCLYQTRQLLLPNDRIEIAQWIDNAEKSPNKDTHHLFPGTAPSLADRKAMRIRAYDAMSNECAEEWIVHGRWDAACIGTNLSEGLKVDGVWAWVNGSDPVQVASRLLYRPDSTMKMDAIHRYADHNELLFSMRSAAASLGTDVMSRMHILASAYWLHNQSDGDMAGQVPAWLEKEKAVTGLGDITLQHDANFFTPMYDPRSESTAITTRQWWDATIPSFNSLAVESQIHNVEHTSCDQLVYYNDDFFTMAKLAVSDFTTPLYGPVIKTITKLTSLYRPAENTLWRTWNPAGEEPGIMRAAWVLAQRFSMRSHYYITHHPRALWLPLLREAAQTFPDAFSDTALSRFRAENDVPPSIQTVFLASWYVVERHREALLWSWIVAKWGGRDGVMNRETKQQMWEELADGELTTSSYLQIRIPVRTPAENVHTFKRAGVEVPTSTEYSFSSKDGYALAYVDYMWYWDRPRHGYPDLTKGLLHTSHANDDTGEYSRDPKFFPATACIVRWSECFASTENETTDEVFKRIAFQNQRCGDCIITGLVGASGLSGIHKFLPEHNDNINSESFSGTDDEPAHLPLTSEWRKTNFSLSQAVPEGSLHRGMPLRDWCIRLIQRYSYVLGSAESEMYKVETARGLESELERVAARVESDEKMKKQKLAAAPLGQQQDVVSQPDEYDRWRNRLGEGQGPLAFLCLNDDVKETGGLRYVVDQLLLNFFQKMWSNRLESERVP